MIIPGLIRCIGPPDSIPLTGHLLVSWVEVKSMSGKHLSLAMMFASKGVGCHVVLVDGDLVIRVQPFLDLSSQEMA